MNLNTAIRGIVRFVVQQLEHAQQSAVTTAPPIKGVGNPPQESRAGVLKLVFVAGASLGIGGWIAHEGARYLDNRGYFTPSDDDDDD